jgi:hypothetical protein
MRLHRHLGQSGVTLLEVLLAIGMGIILMLGTINFMRNTTAVSKGNGQRLDLDELREQIFYGIDCDATFANAVIDPQKPGASCNSTSAAGGQVGPFLTLYRKSTTTPPKPLYGFSGGVAKVGDWTVRASCSKSEASLVVRVARPVGSGFAADPITGAAEDWSAPDGLVFGGGGSLPLCFQRAKNSYFQGTFAALNAALPAGNQYPAGFYANGCPPAGPALPALTNNSINFYWGTMQTLCHQYCKDAKGAITGSVGSCVGNKIGCSCGAGIYRSNG